MPRIKQLPPLQKTTVLALVEGAYSEINTLAEEMREAYDNTPENLQNSGVGEARGLAADELENYMDAPELPEGLDDLGNIEVEFRDNADKRPSRSSRRDQASSELSIALDAIENYIGKLEEEINDLTTNEDDPTHEALEEKKSNAEEWKEEIEQARDGIDSVEFPGMYG